MTRVVRAWTRRPKHRKPRFRYALTVPMLAWMLLTEEAAA